MKSLVTLCYLLSCVYIFGQTPVANTRPTTSLSPAQLQQLQLLKQARQAGNRAPQAMLIDYDGFDENRATTVNGDYSRFIWRIQTQTPDVQNFNNVSRWAAVVFDTIINSTTNLGYNINTTPYTLDSLDIYFSHERNPNSVKTDSIRIIVYAASGASGIQVNAQQNLTNTLLWDTLIRTNTNLTPNATTLGIMTVYPRTTLGMGQRFVVAVEVRGDTTNEFNLLAGYTDLCNGNCAAVPSAVEDNSIYRMTFVPSSGGNFSGVNPLFANCNGNSTYDPLDCEDYYIQNWVIGAYVTADPPLSVSPRASATVGCPGQIVTLNSNATGGSGNYSYAWSGPGSFSATNTPNTTVILPTGNITATYSITVTDLSNSSVTTGSVVVTVRGITLDLGPDALIACGSTQTLTPSLTGFLNGATFVWSTGASTQSINVNNPGTYSVTVTNNAGCTATDSKVLNSNVNQSVSFAASTVYAGNGPDTVSLSQNRICQGAIAFFENTSLDQSGTWTFEWNFGDGTGSINVDATKSYFNTGTYPVTLTATNGGCVITSNPLNLQVLPSNHPLCTGPDPLIVSVWPNNITICTGDNMQLSATAQGGSGSYTYSWAPAAGLSCNNCSNPIATPANTTTYTVTVNDGSTTATANATITVDVPTTPSVTISAAQLPLCFNQANTINVNVTGIAQGNYTLYLLRNGNLVGTLSGLSYSIFSNQFSAGDQLTVQMYPLFGCVTGNPISNTLFVGQCSSALSLLLSSNQDICTGGSTSLSAQGDGGSGSYTYSWTPATGLSCTNCANPTATPQATTTYTVTVNDGQNSISGNITITVVDVNVDAGADITICGTGSATLFANTQATNVVWSPSTGLSCTNCTSPVASPQVTTTYTVTATRQTPAGTCTATDNVTVTVAASASASVSITSNPSPACTNSGPITFTALPVNGGSANYQWQLNGNNTGTNSSTLVLNGLLANDVVSCSMTSSLSCVATPTVVSNSITVSPCVGIHEATRSLSFQVQPNPSVGIFYVNAPMATTQDWNITIYDLTGREVFNQTTVGNSLQQYPIDLSGFGKGVYILRLGNGQAQGHQRLVVY